MLADLPHPSASAGKLSPELHLPLASFYAILDFVAAQLPAWRDRADRPQERSETGLTSHLCAHLNSAVRHAEGWDILQFRTELPDEEQKGRKIDLAPSPCGVTLCIEGRNYSDFDMLLPIECKRLPTPKATDRDEREYVVHRTGSTGGIQRFKDGHHGAAHQIGGMIAYLQEDTANAWTVRIASWISDLAQASEVGWSANDLLTPVLDDKSNQVSVFRSSHDRKNGLPRIELHHIWISMC